MPVRKPRNGYGRHFIGTFSSIKLKRSVNCESTIERDLYFLLDFDKDVVSFEEQPLVIPYTLAGRAHTYTPDVLITYFDGRQVIGECKPSVFLEKENTKRQVAAGEMYCKLNNRIFRLYTDVALRSGFYLGNVKRLHKFARYELPTQVFDITEKLRHLRAESFLVYEVAKYLSADNPQEQFYTVLNLLYHRILEANLHDLPITDASRVWFTRTLEESL